MLYVVQCSDTFGKVSVMPSNVY